MSQPELLSQLREARPAAPAELRERVRLLAADAAPPPRRVTWRRGAVVLLPVAAAIAAAVVLIPHGAKRAAPVPQFERAGSAGGARAAADHVYSSAPKAVLGPVPSPVRAQRYSATLTLRLRSAQAVSDTTKRASRIVASLGGYPASLNVNAGGRTGYADLRFRVPRTHVQDAIRRLGALGTIVNENVSVEDVQAQVNASADLIAGLQRQLVGLRAQPQTKAVQRRVVALTERIVRLQRARATTLREARYATVELQLTTRTPPPPVHRGHGPLHGLGIAFHWLWVGAAYVLALGAPLVVLAVAIWLLARIVRRRREEALLSRS